VSGYDLEKEQDREDRRKHLELVSAVVARMASASAAAKGWSVTVAGAAFGVALVRSSWLILLIGVGALVVFGILDGLYLHSEKRFRDLYAAIVENKMEPFSMDTTSLPARRKRDSHRSWSVAAFYVPLAVAGIILMCVSLGTDDVKQDGTQHSTQNGPATTSSSVAPSTSVAPRTVLPTSVATTTGSTSPVMDSPVPTPTRAATGP
jgi:hypothetical protein